MSRNKALLRGNLLLSPMPRKRNLPHLLILNCTVTDGVVTSEVSGKKIQVDAKTLCDILGIPTTGFDLYVWEDKSMLGKARLLELARMIG